MFIMIIIMMILKRQERDNYMIIKYCLLDVYKRQIEH